MVTVEVTGAHTPFAIVQASVLTPAFKAVIAVVANEGEAMLPPPPISDQLPVPDKGTLPISCVLGVLMHTV